MEGSQFSITVVEDDVRNTHEQTKNVAVKPVGYDGMTFGKNAASPMDPIPGHAVEGGGEKFSLPGSAFGWVHGATVKGGIHHAGET